jgi:transposase
MSLRHTMDDEKGGGEVVGLGRVGAVVRSGIGWCREPAPEHGPERPEAPWTAALSAHTRLSEGRALPPRRAASAAAVSRAGWEGEMEVRHPRCAGLDVHKRSVVACALLAGADGTVGREVATFGTMTADLEALAGWLAERAVPVVALEATGVYWKPVYNVLEAAGGVEVLVVNPEHLRAVPGRKTDVKDAEWLADLLRHGLVRGSFIPDRAQRELRELVRYRTALIRERAREVNRLQKVLEGANLKLATVLSDVTGVSGRRILEALVQGVEDPTALADLAHWRVQRNRAALEQAVVGRLSPVLRFVVRQQLAHLDALEGQVAACDAAVAEQTRPFAEALARLQTIDGIGRRTAEVLVAELGVDLGRFPTARHLAAWAGLCPGNRESGGKRQPARARKGSPWLRAALAEAAWAAGRKRDGYLAAQFRRLAARRGKKRAIVAVAHSILVIAYHLLTEQTTYRDLGTAYFDHRDREAVRRRAVRRLEAVGYVVHVEDPTEAA